jgi:hypothetical protein
LAQDAPQRAAGLSPSRRALLGMYATLQPKLAADLQVVGVVYPDDLDPYAMLAQAAKEPAEDGERPRLHGLHLAFGAMRLLEREPPPPSSVDHLRAVADRLVDPDQEPGTARDRSAEIILEALEHAARPGVDPKRRWAQVVQEVTDRGASLDPELAAIEDAWCETSLREVNNEFASRVETSFVVRARRSVDQLALAVLPDNWKTCNDFFCDLFRAADRDGDCPGTTGGDLLPSATRWRGVYQERVGGCPEGWFPDTYLLFSWRRSQDRIILRYELAPSRTSDKTVLKIDQGYIQIDRLPETYQVSTLKNLLFDDRRMPGGGQTLASMACELGWLDYAINQFTVCAGGLHPSVQSTPTSQRPAGIDAGIQEVLDRCQAHLLETASDADAQFTRVMAKVRDGSYSLDECVGDWGKATVRALRDGSRSLRAQVDLGLRTADMARAFARRRASP